VILASSINYIYDLSKKRLHIGEVSLIVKKTNQDVRLIQVVFYLHSRLLERAQQVIK